MKLRYLLAPYEILLSSSMVVATFWTVTHNLQTSTSVRQIWKGGRTTSRTTQTARRDVIPTNEPTSSRTAVFGSSNVTVVYVYYEYGTFDIDNEIQERHDYRNKTTTRYAISTTYTAAASCPTNFTAVTTLDVYPKSHVTPLLTPTKLISETITDGTVTVRAFVEAASMTTPNIDGLYRRQLADCRRPNSTIVLPEEPDSGTASRISDEVAMAACGVASLAILLVYLGVL